MGKKVYQKVDWGNMLLDYIPTNIIPDEIVNYYVSHRYRDRGIPLNVKTCMEIRKILDENNS